MKKSSKRRMSHLRNGKQLAANTDRVEVMFSRKSPLKIFFLFFSVYLLFSVVYVVFDQHQIAPSNTCPLCSLKKSLSSAISQFPVITEVDLNKIYTFWIEKIFYFEGSASYPNLSYRGPPAPAIHFKYTSS
jgi:hypothetical protein